MWLIIYQITNKNPKKKKKNNSRFLFKKEYGYQIY